MSVSESLPDPSRAPGGDPETIAVPEAPWLRTPRKPRERAPLNRELIVDAALRLVDREGAAAEEYLRGGATGGAAASHDFVHELREYFASLPVESFPNIVALAGPLTSGGPDERFEFGIEVLVDGLVAQSKRHA